MSLLNLPGCVSKCDVCGHEPIEVVGPGASPLAHCRSHSASTASAPLQTLQPNPEHHVEGQCIVSALDAVLAYEQQCAERLGPQLLSTEPSSGSAGGDG